MKRLILICTIAAAFVSGNALASFPIKKSENNQSETKIENTTVDQQNTEFTSTEEVKHTSETVSKDQVTKENSRVDEEFIITLVLWFFLGFLAAHRWYRGKPAVWNILFIITAGGLGIWALVDLINILTGNF